MADHTKPGTSSHPEGVRLSGRGAWVWHAVRGLVLALAGVAGCCLAGMIGVVCLGVVLRFFGHPIKGSYDIVRLAGALTIACALPITCAVKGHIAIEYFFHKFNRRGRLVLDTLVHGGMMAMFGAAAWQCVRYGQNFLRNGEVTPTLQLPLFWVAWVMALACAASVPVSCYHLLHPGREMIKP